MASVEEDGLSRLTVRRPTRLLASPTNTNARARLSLLVAVEHCTAVRPSASLQGKSEQYTQAAERLEAALAVRCQNIGCGFKLTRNPASKPASTTAHRPAPGRPNYPRIGAFEVSYAIAIAGSAPTCSGIIFSKLQRKLWPNINKLVNDLAAIVERERKSPPSPSVAFNDNANAIVNYRPPPPPPNYKTAGGLSIPSKFVERYLSAEEVYGPPPAAAEDDGIPFPRRIELRPPPPSIEAKVDWTAIEAAAAVSSLQQQQQQKHRPPPARPVATAFGSKLDRFGGSPAATDPMAAMAAGLPASYARPTAIGAVVARPPPSANWKHRKAPPPPPPPRPTVPLRPSSARAAMTPSPRARSLLRKSKEHKAAVKKEIGPDWLCPLCQLLNRGKGVGVIAAPPQLSSPHSPSIQPPPSSPSSTQPQQRALLYQPPTGPATAVVVNMRAPPPLLFVPPRRGASSTAESPRFGGGEAPSPQSWCPKCGVRLTRWNANHPKVSSTAKIMQPPPWIAAVQPRPPPTTAEGKAEQQSKKNEIVLYEHDGSGKKMIQVVSTSKDENTHTDTAVGEVITMSDDSREPQEVDDTSWVDLLPAAPAGAYE